MGRAVREVPSGARNDTKCGDGRIAEGKKPVRTEGVGRERERERQPRHDGEEVIAWCVGKID